MKAVQVREGIYWVGAIDWNIRNFHGYETPNGTTYNAYLILDEKVTLIDTVKAPFTEEMIERIESVISLDKIDVIISNHVEMDHSGGLPVMMEKCPKAEIITSMPSGIKGLTAHYGHEERYTAVKTGDSISLGKRSLVFTGTPMLHWPDNMVTYCPEEKILFSNDAFGQHVASSERFVSQVDLQYVIENAKSYYANIIMCYGKQANGAEKIVETLDLEMIAPSHGLIWTKEYQEILKAYAKWSGEVPASGAVVVYDSMWHSTEKMAMAVADGFKQAGVEVHVFDLKAEHYSKIMPYVLDSKYVAVGSPTLNNNMLPNVAAFLCYLKGLSPKERSYVAFGSYGWGGQSIGQVAAELDACGFTKAIEDVKIQYIPSKEQLEKLEADIAAMAK